MSGRPGSTFGKLQRERARKQKQLEKLVRKQQRKLEKQTAVVGLESSEELVGEAVSDDVPTKAPADSDGQ
jgi:hypothetical protein